MNRYRSLTILVLAVASFWSVLEAHSSLSESLVQRLRSHNFNLYTTPFPANNMVLHNLKGQIVSLSAQKGKVVLLNFWRIECPPCSIEKPILERIFRKYSRRGLEVLAVNLFDSGDKQASYVEGNSFSYTFAFDPSKRFCVRTEALGSRVPSSFVISPNSEAIYEIPGVPTTYVIDRKGQIIGNCVGLVNWEAGPFAEFLESLLGNSSAQSASISQSFEAVAREGTGVGSNQIAQGHVPSSPTYAQASTGASVGTVSSGQPAVTLPFQAPASPEIGTEKLSPQSRDRSTDASQTSESLSKTMKKQGDQGKQSPVKDPTSSAVNASEIKPVPSGGKKKAKSSHPSADKPPVQQLGNEGTFPGRYSPSPLSSFNTTGTGGSRTLPPLPPALPYTPPRTSESTPRQNLFPDQGGSVVARIPSSPRSPQSVSSVRGYQGESRGLPSARPLGEPNPIDGFILDSFGRSDGVQRALIKPETEGVPSSSVFGQVGQDIKQLGTGIKETFSRLLPGS